MRYILGGNYEAALRQIEGARTGGASVAEVENLRGLALMLEGRLDEAIVSFDRALAADASLDAARYNRGLARLRQKDLVKAAADLEAVFAVENSRYRADAAYHLAIARDRQGRATDAEVWLDRALALDPSLDAALLYAGMLRERRGDLQAAGRAYLTYLETHPESPLALLRFGLAARKAGQASTAKKYLERVVAAAPDSIEAIEARKHLVMWE